MLAQLVGAGGQELAEATAPGVGVAVAVGEVEVDAHVHAAVTEVPVGHALQLVALEQLVEVAQPGPEALGRHRGVLPARERLALERAGGQAGAVLADAPQRGGLAGVGDQAVLERLGGRQHGRDQAGVGELDEEPAAAARQVGHAAAAPAHQVDDAGVEALAGHQRRPARAAVGVGSAGGARRGEDGRHRVGGLDHRGVAQHQHLAHRLVGHQAHGRAQHDAEGALGAGEEALEAPAVLGQQVLVGVAADLPGEAPELGAHVGQRGVGDRGQRVAGRRRPATGPHLAGAEGDVEAHHVVGGAAVAERARAAGVVADHPADGAARVRRGVGPEAQPLGQGGALQGGVHGARLDHGRAGLGVDGQHPVEVAGGVDHDAGPDGVAGDRGAGAAHRQRHPGGPRGVEGGEQLVAVPRSYDDAGRHPVERGVGGVERPRQRRVVDVGHAPAAKLGDDVGAAQRLAHAPIVAEDR